MFATPLSVTVSGSAKSLERTGSDLNSSNYSTADGSYRVTTSHSLGRRYRHLIKLGHSSLVANPLISGQNISQDVSVHLVIDTPPGYDTSAMKADVDGFLAFLSATSGAVVTKLLGNET